MPKRVVLFGGPLAFLAISLACGGESLQSQFDEITARADKVRADRASTSVTGSSGDGVIVRTGAAVIGADGAQVTATADDGSTVTARVSSDGTAQVTATEGGQRLVAGRPENKGTASVTPSGDYAGTWLGVCQRLDACGCSPIVGAAACARVIEATYTQGIDMARGMGTPEPILRSMVMTESMLYAAANSQCSLVCGQMGQLVGATGGATGGTGSKTKSGASVNTNGGGLHVNAGDGDLQVDMSAGPDGLSIQIDDDDDW